MDDHLVLGAVNFIYDDDSTMFSRSRVIVGDRTSAPPAGTVMLYEFTKNDIVPGGIITSVVTPNSIIPSPGQIEMFVDLMPIDESPAETIIRRERTNIFLKAAPHPMYEPTGRLTLFGVVEIDWTTGEFITSDASVPFDAKYNIKGKAKSWTVDFEFIIQKISDDNTIEVSVWSDDVLVARFEDTRLVGRETDGIEFYAITAFGDLPTMREPGLVVGTICQLIFTVGGTDGMIYGPISFIRLSLTDVIDEVGWRGSDRQITEILNSNQIDYNSYANSSTTESTMSHHVSTIADDVYIPAVTQLTGVDSDDMYTRLEISLNDVTLLSFDMPNEGMQLIPMIPANSPTPGGFKLSDPAIIKHNRTYSERIPE